MREKRLGGAEEERDALRVVVWVGWLVLYVLWQEQWRRAVN